MSNKFAKAIKAITAGIAVALILTGCVSQTDTVTVNADGTGSISSTLIIDKTSATSFLMTNMNKSQEDAKSYVSDLGKQIKSTYQNNPSYNQSNVKWDVQENDNTVNVSLSQSGCFFGNGCNSLSAGQQGYKFNPSDDRKTLNFSYDVTNGIHNMVTSTGSYDQYLSSIMDAWTLTINFPGKVGNASNNGKIDGNTVTWDKDSLLQAFDSQQPLTATSELPAPNNTGSLLIYIVGGVLLIGLAGAAIFFSLSRNKAKKKKQDIMTAAPMINDNFNVGQAASFSLEPTIGLTTIVSPNKPIPIQSEIQMFSPVEPELLPNSGYTYQEPATPALPVVTPPKKKDSVLPKPEAPKKIPSEPTLTSLSALPEKPVKSTKLQTPELPALPEKKLPVGTKSSTPKVADLPAVPTRKKPSLTDLPQVPTRKK